VREWVQEHGREIPPAAWRPEEADEPLPRGPRRVDDPAGLRLFDIAPGPVPIDH
jgi:hypothetical protein